MNTPSLVAVDLEFPRGSVTAVAFRADYLARSSVATQSSDVLPHVKELLRWRSRVRDAWRYSFTVLNGEVQPKWGQATGKRTLPLSDFPFDSDVRLYSGGLNIILLVLESPHISEYRYHAKGKRVLPKGPAQGLLPGDAGGAIRQYGLQVLTLLAKRKRLDDGEYALVLTNPVPYLTSLHWMDVLLGQAEAPHGGLKDTVRNHVWKRLWIQPGMKDHFIQRCRQYKPVAILNCCTGGLTSKYSLKNAVSSALLDAGFGEITYCAHHPSYNWMVSFAENSKRPMDVTPAVCLC
jgi:hypothetical protein